MRQKTSNPTEIRKDMKVRWTLLDIMGSIKKIKSNLIKLIGRSRNQEILV